MARIMKHIGLVLSIIGAIGLGDTALAADKNDADTLGNLNCSTDQIARFNGAQWVCSNDREAALGGGALIVRDSLGEDFGLFITGDLTGNTWVAVDVNGQLYSLQLLERQYYIDDFLVYASDDCTGTPYYLSTGFNVDGLFKVAQVASPGHSLYVQNGPREVITIGSAASNGSCDTDSGGGDPEPLIPLVFVEDLDLSFTPPFSVE